MRRRCVFVQQVRHPTATAIPASCAPPPPPPPPPPHTPPTHTAARCPAPATRRCAPAPRCGCGAASSPAPTRRSSGTTMTCGASTWPTGRGSRYRARGGPARAGGHTYDVRLPARMLHACMPTCPRLSAQGEQGQLLTAAAAAGEAGWEATRVQSSGGSSRLPRLRPAAHRWPSFRPSPAHAAATAWSCGARRSCCLEASTTPERRQGKQGW